MTESINKRVSDIFEKEIVQRLTRKLVGRLYVIVCCRHRKNLYLIEINSTIKRILLEESILGYIERRNSKTNV